MSEFREAGRVGGTGAEGGQGGKGLRGKLSRRGVSERPKRGAGMVEGNSQHYHSDRRACPRLRVRHPTRPQSARTSCTRS